MSSEATSPRRTSPRLADSTSILGYLSYPLTRPSGNTQARALATRQPDCSELIKDRGLLARAIAKYLVKYPSVGSLRLTIDLLGPCAKDPVEAFLRYVKPVLLILKKMGFVELALDDPILGFAVVNLALPNQNAQARGGGDGSG